MLILFKNNRIFSASARFASLLGSFEPGSNITNLMLGMFSKVRIHRDHSDLGCHREAFGLVRGEQVNRKRLTASAINAGEVKTQTKRPQGGNHVGVI